MGTRRDQSIAKGKREGHVESVKHLRDYYSA